MAGIKHNFINVQWIPADQAVENRSPANPDDLVGLYARDTAAEVDAAVVAAKVAVSAWSKSSPQVRADVLRGVGAVVPQGGNAGLCGAAVAGNAGEVILSLSRMAAMDAPDLASGTITVQAGVVLAALHAALDGTGLMFPLHLGAEGTLGIVTRAVLRLSPQAVHRQTALLALPDATALVVIGSRLCAPTRASF